MKQKLSLAILFSLFYAPFAHSVEFVGLVADNIPSYSERPSNYIDSGGGIGYAFYGRVDLGPGMIETGFLYTQTSFTTSQSFGNVKTSGSFWILPLIYRIYVLPPFVSIGVGPDFAILGDSTIAVAGNNLGSYSSGYKSHYGLEASLEATQEFGENLGVVLDLRYRHALADTLTINGTGMRYHLFSVGSGIQKRLE